VIEPLDVTSASIRARHRLRRFGERTLSRASARSRTASLAPRGGVHITLDLRDPDAGTADAFSDARSRLPELLRHRHDALCHRRDGASRRTSHNRCALREQVIDCLRNG